MAPLLAILLKNALQTHRLGLIPTLQFYLKNNIATFTSLIRTTIDNITVTTK